MTGKTSSKSCEIERIEWTDAKGDEQPTVKIKYKLTHHARHWRGFFMCNRETLKDHLFVKL